MNAKKTETIRTTIRRPNASMMLLYRSAKIESRFSVSKDTKGKT